MTGMYSKAKCLTWIVRAVQQRTTAAQDLMSKNVQEDLLYCRGATLLMLLPQASCQLEKVQPQCYTKVRVSYSFLLEFLVGGGNP